MRCLTLADALKLRGAQMRFISRRLPDYLKAIIEARGHRLAMLDDASGESAVDGLQHSHWLGTSQASDAGNTMQILSDGDWDWLVVDHYALDERWESALRKMAKNIFVIDDLADRQHDCDILLDQNYYPDMPSRYAGKLPAHCRQLLGTRYLLLREEFRQQGKHVKTRGGRVERLLVVFGGADTDNNTGRALEALSMLSYPSLQVDVVIGAQHPFGELIAATCMQLGYSCHRQTSRMAELMSAADLAIGACGFTSYEFAAMRLPAILIPVTEIQATVANLLMEKGIAFALPPGEGRMVEEIAAALNRIIGSEPERASMSRACMDFLDTNGVDRVADEILALGSKHE